MLIIDKKNKDYYDGVVGTMGIDKTIVYKRNTIEIEDSKDMPKEFQSVKNRSWNHRRENHFLNVNHVHTDSKKYDRCDSFIIGFCGKLYLGWKLHYRIKVKYFNGLVEDEWRTDIIYDYENAKQHIKTGFWGENLDNDIKHILKYDPINMFRKVNSPIFVYDNYSVNHNRNNKNGSVFIINPILKDYEFYKVVDSFTAFQEIQMFIAGVLGIGEKEIIEVDDKYKIPQHGFDKWSFRKKPSKKK